MLAAARRRWRARVAAWMRPRAPETLPVRLGRRRIYVLPTRFGWFFAAALLAMGIGALNYNNNPALLLVLVLAGAAHSSLIAVHLQLSGLVVEAVSADPVPAGTDLLLRLRAGADEGRRWRVLRAACCGTHAALSVDASGGEADLRIPTRRRGWLDPGRIELSSIRPLGLARSWAFVWPDTPLLVYPAPEAGGPPLPADGGERGPARLQRSGDDVHHLRGYRSGDARRTIAWKPSARRDTLLVREYEQPASVEVVLDWGGLGGLPYEQRIRRLARWIDEAEREARRYRLQLPGQPPLGPANGPAHRHACLRALALLPHVSAA